MSKPKGKPNILAEMRKVLEDAQLSNDDYSHCGWVLSQDAWSEVICYAEYYASHKAEKPDSILGLPIIDTHGIGISIAKWVLGPQEDCLDCNQIASGMPDPPTPKGNPGYMKVKR